jgi:hypothetical protein
VSRIKSILAAAVAATAIVGGFAALAGAANAAPRVASSLHFTSNTFGEAGYYGNDDNATRYKYTQTTVIAQPSLVNLNGDTANGPGAVGTELCDPNNGFALQVGLWWDAANSRYDVSYNQGNTFQPATGADPCIQDGFVIPDISSTPQLVGPNAPTAVHISSGDQVALAIYFDPPSHFGHHHVVISACDLTQGFCRQYENSTYAPSTTMWEFGTGAVTNNTKLTAPAAIPLESFSNTKVTSYMSANPVPVGSVGPLGEANFVNTSFQTVMSPNGTLVTPGGSAFTLFEGSTSA